MQSSKHKTKGNEMTDKQLADLESRIEAAYRIEQIERMKDALRAVEQASTQRYRTSSVWGVAQPAGKSSPAVGTWPESMQP